jgi:O-antigen/teichoic acid export membrane protein
MAGRAILLAHLLPIEIFGTYALATTIIALSVLLAEFGLGDAFLHLTADDRDTEQSAAVHFTLKSLFLAVWAAMLLVATSLLAKGQMQTMLYVLVCTTVGMQLTQTPRLLLVRRIQHRLLAVVHTMTIILSTVAMGSLAWLGHTLWALLSADVIATLSHLILLYIWRPVWQPRFVWIDQTVRDFIRIGSRNVAAGLLAQALDRLDNLWVGLYLGDTALGLYSRAYRFAIYPRQLLAAPVHTVAKGLYAAAQHDRLLLSKSFFRVNALLVRNGLWLAGLAILLAPEFIHYVLGTKWMPMLEAFRWLLLFMLFDPIKSTAGNLLTVLGKGEKVVLVQLLQLAILLLGMVTLGPVWGIAGIALAVTMMLLVGISLLMWQAQAYVDFSGRQLFGAPLLTFVVAFLGTDMLLHQWHSAGVSLAGLILKFLTFTGLYVGCLAILEYQHARRAYWFLKRLNSAGRKA